MFKEKLQSRKDANKEKLLDCAGQLIPQVIYYFALNNESYPRCCREACSTLGQIIKQNSGIRLKMCRGSVTFVSANERCTYHAWLEHEDLIIDPTDFQFNVVDVDELPFTEENIIPQDIDFDPNRSQDDWNQLFFDTWNDNNLKRYMENPNEKEKYFQDLNDLLREEKIDPEDYFLELQRCFKFKAFYDKNDQDRIYEAEHVEPVILNATIRKIARLVLGRW